mgnify:CR=1 FL=1
MVYQYCFSFKGLTYCKNTRDEAVKLSAKGWGARLVCLGTTIAGHPRHPLYVRGDQPFQDLAPARQDSEQPAKGGEG